MQRHTLVLTDLVDSTRWTLELGDDRAASLWAHHDRMARDLCRLHGGREIDKTDGFLLLFEDPGAARDHVRAYHAALGAVGERFGVRLAARAGLHVAQVVLRENPPDDVARGAKPLEVEGIAKPTAARVMALAPAGRTLCTAEAREALGEGDSVGTWQIKGLTEVVELFELVPPSGQAGPPPPDGEKAWQVVLREGRYVPMREVPRSLPIERDEFVGRARDLNDLARCLEQPGPVTVLGPGGCGKTRLVVHHAWSWLGAWPGGAWFCDLADARDLDGIWRGVARAMGVTLAGLDPGDQLGHAIGGRGRCLVLLDNFEQVARHAREVLDTLGDRAPQARFVCTSREVLGARGEQVLALEPLDEDAGCDLFVARARAADHRFEPPAREELRGLVRMLDALPLALELAAARVRAMSVATLTQRLNERFRLLAGASSRGRHATLRATIDWSWNLSSPAEQRCLAQLSVFEGGFDLEAAEAVVDAGTDAPWMVDTLGALVDRSLVRRIENDRFDLLVSVREYAAERLAAEPNDQAVERRHGAWFARLGSLEASRSMAWMSGDGPERFQRELDNLLAAARRAQRRRDPELAAPTTRAAAWVLRNAGPVAGAVPLLLDTLALLPPSVERTSLRLLLVDVNKRLGRPEDAQAAFDEAEREAATLDDDGLAAGLHSARGTLASQRGRTDDAALEYERGLGLALRAGDRAMTFGLQANQGALLMLQGRHDAAWALHQEVLADAREGDYRVVMSDVLSTLSILASHRADWDAAQACADEAIELSAKLGHHLTEARVWSQRGASLTRQGAFDAAAVALERALTLSRRFGARSNQAMTHLRLGNLEVERGAPDLAEQHYRSALEVFTAVGDRGNTVTVRTSMLSSLMRQGRYADALVAVDQLVADNQRFGIPKLQANITLNRGTVLAGLGRLPEAHEAAAEAVRLAVEVREVLTEDSARVLLSRVNRRLGDFAGAVAEARAALALATQVGDPQRITDRCNALCAALLLAGQPAEARSLLLDRLEDQRESRSPLLSAMLINLAEAELAMGEFGAAEGRLDEAEAALAVTPVAQHAAALWCLRAGILARQPARHAEAFAALARARDRVAALPSAAEREELERDLAKVLAASSLP